MFILTICLFIAACYPFLSKVPLGYAMTREGQYDNHQPRLQQHRLTGFGARALAAHQNSFEALLIFGLGALSVMIMRRVTPTVDILAITFVISRFVYHVAYLMNLSSLRSLVWFVGFLSSMSMLALSIPF